MPLEEQEEVDGTTAAATTQTLAREFHAEGFVELLPSHLRPSEALVERARAAALRKFDAHLRQASRRELDLRLPENAEALDGFYVRQGGRVDMQISALALQVPRATGGASEDEDADLAVDPAPFREMARCWQSLVDAIFRGDGEAPAYRLEYVGCVVARPGDADQNWHLDGVHRNLLAHESADRLNVFVPLADLRDERVGGTEMKRKSHVRDTRAGGAAFAAYAHLPSVTHRVAAGTPIAMDYRVWHRGLANRSESLRPLLYFKYVKQAPPTGDRVAKRAPAADAAERKKKRVVLTHVATTT